MSFVVTQDNEEKLKSILAHAGSRWSVIKSNEDEKELLDGN